MTQDTTQAAKEYENAHKPVTWWEDGEFIEVHTPLSSAFEEGADYFKTKVRIRVKNEIIRLKGINDAHARGCVTALENLLQDLETL